jgi:hypothetical protein
LSAGGPFGFQESYPKSQNNQKPILCLEARFPVTGRAELSKVSESGLYRQNGSPRFRRARGAQTQLELHETGPGLTDEHIILLDRNIPVWLKILLHVKASIGLQEFSVWFEIPQHVKASIGLA